MSGEEFINLDLCSEAPQLENKEESCNAEEEEEGEIQEEEGANEIEQGDHANSEEAPQLENLKENSNAEEEGEIPVEDVHEIEQGDDPNVEDMDLEDDVVVSKQSVLHASSEVLAVSGGETSSTVIKSSTDIVYQTPPLAPRGVKRARVEYTTENEPSVRVVFSSLTRESKRKLMELMQRWSEWQAKHPSSSSMMEKNEEALESGEDIYYPALHVGSSASNISTMSFWIDNQARTDNVKDESSVPLYDREFSLGSSSLDGAAAFESRSAKDDARCFNCGSYGHALKECPKPRNMAAISNARKEHSAKKNHSNANHGQSRYYLTKPGKFDDLKPGFLGAETRECLGIGEFDPPPWLHRMREMGYPPGYLETVEDKNKPSGIMIFNDEEEKDKNSDKKDEYEEGELPGQSERSSAEKVMTVEFPGINAPIPEKADPFLWSVNPLPAPPIYPPRYNPYDQYNGSSYQSSTLNRSLSDRGRYDGSLSHSPHSKSSYPHSSADLVFGRDSERERSRELRDRSADLVNLYGRDSERDRGREFHDRSADLVNLYGRDGERDRGREFHDHRRHHRHHGR